MDLVLFDTNILIDHTLGIWAATVELGSHENAAISAVGWMETACKLHRRQVDIFDDSLLEAGIVVLQTTPFIMRRAAQLRGKTSKKLPDCIILATAEIGGRVVVTRNAADFGGTSGAETRVAVRIPYRLTNGVVTEVTPLPH